MTNKDLISQYVDTGVGIPEYQFDKLPNWAKKTYLRKIKMSLDYDINNIKYYYGDYGELPEETQLKLVNNDDWAIQYINSPSERVQLAAVNNDGYAIVYINNPSERVQLAAVNNNGWAIQYINNPSEKVQLTAVNNDGLAIRDIIDKNITPSEKVQLTAVNNNGYAIQYINNPSERLQLAAVNKIVAISNDAMSVSKNLSIVYNVLSDDVKFKVVKFLLDNDLIMVQFYEKSDDKLKQYILDRIISDRLKIDDKFYKLLPESRKLDYLKMTIAYVNKNRKFLADWEKQEYEKLTGITLVRDGVSRQYVKRNDK